MDCPWRLSWSRMMLRSPCLARPSRRRLSCCPGRPGHTAPASGIQRPEGRALLRWANCGCGLTKRLLEFSRQSRSRRTGRVTFVGRNLGPSTLPAVAEAELEGSEPGGDPRQGIYPPTPCGPGGAGRTPPGVRCRLSVSRHSDGATWRSAGPGQSLGRWGTWTGSRAGPGTGDMRLEGDRGKWSPWHGKPGTGAGVSIANFVWWGSGYGAAEWRPAASIPSPGVRQVSGCRSPGTGAEPARPRCQRSFGRPHSRAPRASATS